MTDARGAPRGTTTRRSALTALLGTAASPLAAQVPEAGAPPPRSLDDWRRALGVPAGAFDAVERQRALDQGESLLAAGEAHAAHDAFQRAALMAHAADTECSIVRALMQMGDYRRALAFGAHTALAHRDFPAGSALYAWLLHCGGQSAFASRRLDEALAMAPDNAALRIARQQLSSPWPASSGVLLERPLHIAPYAHGVAAAPREAAVVASATLWHDGAHAIAPLVALGGADRAWLRNGLGATVAAQVEVRDAALGLARLRLATPLQAPPLPMAAAREPFAGSPATTVEFAPTADSTPAWPLLRQGFLGRVTSAGDRALGLDVPLGPRGGPVFDSAGRWAGLALHTDRGVNRFVPVAALATLAPSAWPAATAAAPAAPLDAVYELALRIALQLLREPKP